MEKLMRKVEEMDSDERKKLRKALQEKTEASSKIDWMYTGDKVESEDYLLGKRVDKHAPQTVIADDAEEVVDPSALSEELIKRRADIDMQAKMREDPLFAIRKREEEEKKKLLMNPIRMKQLQKVLKAKDKDHKKVKKKSKKHKKHRSSSSDDSSDELMAKYLQIVSMKKMQKKSSGSMDSSKHDSHTELSLMKNSDTNLDTYSRKAKSKHGYDSNGNKNAHKSRSFDSKNSDSSDGEKHEKRSGLKKYSDESDDEISPKKSFGLIVKGNDRSSNSNKHRNVQHLVKRASPETKQIKSPPKKKLTKDEMNKKREEMMNNAKWRDEQRVSNIKRYREDDLKEAYTHNKNEKEHVESSFIKPLMANHASQSSVEDRVKRNIYNVQRTKADLEKGPWRK